MKIVIWECTECSCTFDTPSGTFEHAVMKLHYRWREKHWEPTPIWLEKNDPHAEGRVVIE